MQVRVARYDDADVVAMTAEVQAEYGRRYGGDGDASPIDAAEFAPPRGLFLVADVDGVPAAMGGWRRGGPAGDTDAEVKRMYVRDAFRRRGLARLVLGELERTAAQAGIDRLVLETGSKQPEAMAMYYSSGYEDVEPFGYYACSPSSIHLAKRLHDGTSGGRVPEAEPALG